MAIDKIEISEDQKKFEIDADRYLGEWIKVLTAKINELIDKVNDAT